MQKKTSVTMILVLVFLVVATLILFDTISDKKEFTKNSYAMSANISQTLTGKDAEKVSEEIHKRIVECENREISFSISLSDIARVNSDKKAKVSDNTITYIKELLEFSKNCGGVFDITAGALIREWAIGTDDFRVPDKNEIEKLLKTVGYDKVKVNGNTVEIGENTQLDLGAAGKGIACDEAKKIAEKSDLKKAVVSVGGSVMLWSENGEEEFTVGIRDPEGEAGDYMAKVKTGNCFVSTSGAYERFSADADGKKYHHILSTKNGLPVENEVVSATVFCSSGILSDALSTACFILGEKDSEELLGKYNASAVFLLSDGSVKVSEKFDMDLKITSSKYVLQ